MKVRYSPRAIADLGDIADYLQPRSARGAAAVEAAIKATVRLIEEYPKCGRSVEQRPKVLVIPLGRYPYLIFYTIEGESAVILHVRHAARKPLEPGEL